MAYISGTIWIVLGIIVVSVGWKIWKQRAEIKARTQYYIASKIAEKALKSLTSPQKVKGSHSANTRE